MATLDTVITHRDITATGAQWCSLGYVLYSNVDTLGSEPYGMDALLLRARLATSADDWRALAWALDERLRRQECASATAALDAHARAIGMLSAALEEHRDQDVIDRLLASLTERTRYAVLAQARRA